MARTLSQIRALVDSKLGKASGTLSSSDYLAGLNAALDTLKLQVDFPEAEKTATLTPALFQDVLTYTPPTDLYGDAIIDVRPLTEIPNTRWNNNWARNTSVEFENNILTDREGGKISFEYNAGTKTLKLFPRPLPNVQNISLNNCDTYNGNGTWTADTTNSDALNVQTDAVNYYEGGGSVSFDVTVSQSVNHRAVIYNPSMSQVDTSVASTVVNPYLFFYVYLPSVTNFTSVVMYVGSDSSATPSTKANYYTFTATTQFDGSALVAGLNLIGVAKSAATETGSVDDTAIRYLELRLNYTASYANQTGVRVDGIFYREGILYNIRYYSSNIVSNASGTKQQYFTADDDYLLLNADGEMLFTDWAAAYLAPNVRDRNTGAAFTQIAQASLMQYLLRYPRQRRMSQRYWH